ncbi:hypothetical protein AGR4A_Lc130247 [Agrobacterium tumefaciens str. B6]|uniref:Uncharacterized protein n=1 Tax=Agrobacterium tumefaciens str. B6 TaxID=1183423 RepID=A0A822V899_AGRTU|nr:hypothetical protein AGR4A_Lc130247 [Agrobacterium tumefaciens str. B6]
MNLNTSKPSAASRSIRLYAIAGAGTLAEAVQGA